jgi:hypothetical protein
MYEIGTVRPAETALRRWGRGRRRKMERMNLT